MEAAGDPGAKDDELEPSWWWLLLLPWRWLLALPRRASMRARVLDLGAGPGLGAARAATARAFRTAMDSFMLKVYLLCLMCI